MADESMEAANTQTFKGPIFGTTVTVEVAEKKLKEYFKTGSVFGSNFKIVRIGVGQVWHAVRPKKK